MKRELMRKRFSANLNRILLENGMAQKDLCEKMSIKKQTVSSWCTERGIPTLPLLCELADIFNVSIEELVQGSVRGSVREAQDEVELINTYRLLDDDAKLMIRQLCKKLQ